MVDEKFVITPIKDSKKINKVLSNDTARDILEILAEKSMSATQLAEKMKLPLTTVDYSLKQLESVGLVKTRTGFNKNHRIVKYYEPQEKFIILAPGKSENFMGMLKSVLPFVGILGVVSIVAEYFSGANVTREFAMDASKSVPASAGSEFAISDPHYGIIIFAVGMFAIGMYILWKTKLRNIS